MMKPLNVSNSNKRTCKKEYDTPGDYYFALAAVAADSSHMTALSSAS